MSDPAVVTLDSKNRMIDLHHVSTGSLSSSVVHPREVLKPGVLDHIVFGDSDYFSFADAGLIEHNGGNL